MDDESPDSAAPTANGKYFTDPKLTPKQRRFLAAFTETYSLKAAATASGVDRRYHYFWIEYDYYKQAFERAQQIAGDNCEAEIYRRGILGYSEELAYKGEKTGSTVKRYSDVLAIVAAKALRPHRYRENTTNKVIVNMPVSFQLVMPQLERPQPLLVDSESGNSSHNSAVQNSTDDKSK